MSTLYICFKPTEINSDFLEVYYETDRWYREVSACAAEGARNHGLLNIPPSDFFHTKLNGPSTDDEQATIGNFFRILDDIIAQNETKLTQLKSLKKAYLQKMFI